MVSFWPHSTAQEWQTTQDNERHPRWPGGMCPGSKKAWHTLRIRRLMLPASRSPPDAPPTWPGAGPSGSAAETPEATQARSGRSLQASSAATPAITAMADSRSHFTAKALVSPCAAGLASP